MNPDAVTARYCVELFSFTMFNLPLLFCYDLFDFSANTTALLVKDGIATTMEKALVQIGFSPSIRLRLLLNVLNYLSKNSEFSSCCDFK